MNVVLLSTSKDRIGKVRAALKRRGLGCVVVPDEGSASAAMRLDREGLFVIDTESMPNLRPVLQNRSQKWPVLALTGRFDSSRWVQIFKAGALEVIGDPLHRDKVDAAFDRLMGKSPPTSVRSWRWRDIARWFSANFTA